MKLFKLKEDAVSDYALKPEFGGRLTDIGVNKETGETFESTPYWEHMPAGTTVTMICDDLVKKFPWGSHTLVVTRELKEKITKEAFYRDFEAIQKATN